MKITDPKERFIFGSLVVIALIVVMFALTIVVSILKMKEELHLDGTVNCSIDHICEK